MPDNITLAFSSLRARTLFYGQVYPNGRVHLPNPAYTASLPSKQFIYCMISSPDKWIVQWPATVYVTPCVVPPLTTCCERTASVYSAHLIILNPIFSGFKNIFRLTKNIKLDCSVTRKHHPKSPATRGENVCPSHPKTRAL